MKRLKRETVVKQRETSYEDGDSNAQIMYNFSPLYSPMRSHLVQATPPTNQLNATLELFHAFANSTQKSYNNIPEVSRIPHTPKPYKKSRPRLYRQKPSSSLQRTAEHPRRIRASPAETHKNGSATAANRMLPLPPPCPHSKEGSVSPPLLVRH